MKVHAWLIDFAHFRENCPTGIIPKWRQKVTQHYGIIKYYWTLSVHWEENYWTSPGDKKGVFWLVFFGKACSPIKSGVQLMDLIWPTKFRKMAHFFRYSCRVKHFSVNSLAIKTQKTTKFSQNSHHFQLVSHCGYICRKFLRAVIVDLKAKILSLK